MKLCEKKPLIYGGCIKLKFSMKNNVRKSEGLELTVEASSCVLTAPPPPSVYVLPTLSLTNEAENSSNTLPNVVIAVPHYKEMRIAFAQFHVR